MTPPRHERKGVRAWGPEGVRAFPEATRGRRLYLLAVTTGLRREELLGLRREDLDLAGGTVSLQQSLVCTRSGLLLQEPNTDRGSHLVTLRPRAREALRRYRATRAREKLLLGLVYQDNGPVFFPAVGGLPDPRNLTRRFEELVKKVGLAPLRFHDLRHTHATVLLGQATHPKTVSERLGYANIGITLDT